MVFAVITASVVSMLISSWTIYRYRQAQHAKRRAVIEYRDASGSGVWCTFDTDTAASEAAVALNDAYAGAKTFWVRDWTIAQPYPAAVPAISPRPRPKAQPKPGTPIVRQVNGEWRVRVRGFEMGYGSGEAGYRAALDAVKRAHME